MEYRRLREADLNSYYNHRLEALREAPTAFLTTYDEEVTRGNSHFAATLTHEGNDRVIFGAFSGKALMGSIGVVHEDRPKTYHKAAIWGMYVDAEARGKGVGGRLLDMAIEHVRLSGRAAAIYLSVEASNKAALKLYESKGFRSWGTEPLAMRFEGRDFDECHMILKL